MKMTPPDIASDPSTLAPLPRWVTARRAEAFEDVAFLSGYALSHLHLVAARPELPHALLRDRLALRAAEACAALSGRIERAAELRDTCHLLRPGDLPGPAGEMYLSWRRAVERPVSPQGLHRALPAVEATEVAVWLDSGQGAPLRRAAAVFETVLRERPRARVPSLIMAEAALAQGMGATHLLPLLALGLKRADFNVRGDALVDACHRAVIAAVPEVLTLASDLTRKAAHLVSVAPKLRAKGAGEAVEMFLTQDAVAPAALPLPDRAARRLCDRLVELGAVRELTGRDTFRLYGV
ncbi:DUF1403 family protein [Celeribacter sp. PS-C1]|uniref:DUF1403 family protein n=1 Tax=Celeribacter sp. PS-C1 TaxID=2820813 RepID=UPI001C6717B4|nr:DUF1403 family protein [Celeribacter sp. PS-C1]MBW6419735.1 DUF1403 family protein [Celeribacter sp. PS-C1]